jgi:Ca-activated chloride channel family protein
MSFGAPGYLAFLALALLAAAAAGFGLRWRAQARARFGALAPGGAMTYVAPLLLVAAIVAAAFGAARPQIGKRQAPSEDRGIDLVVVLDVSQSMLSDDAQPTRLGRAQAEIGALLDAMRGDRAGLVIFAGQPFVRSPLTSDLRALRAIVEGVDHERGLVAAGSDLGAAMRAGQDVLAAGDAQTKAMLVVSDGEDHGAGVDAALAGARGRGIRVYTAGAGTSEGAPVRDIDRASGQALDRRDGSGRTVITRLDAEALRRVAALGLGRYLELSGDGRPLAGLAPEFRGLASTKFGDGSSSSPIERFQIFAALALVLAVTGLLLPALLLQRRSALRRAARLWPLAGAGLLVGAICSTGVAGINRQGNAEYGRERYAAAVDLYRTAQAIDPSRPELYHNAGNAYDRLGDFARAIEETQRALDAPGTGGIESLAEYALGNHYARRGGLDDAREAYKRALLADPDDADAKHNLEVIDARRQATPTRTPRPPTEPTPPDAASGHGGQGGTPQPGQGSSTPGAGTATAGTPSASDGQLTPEQLQQRLDEALAGIEKDFSEDEARRILDLLDRANQQAIEERAGSGGIAAPPDY